MRALSVVALLATPVLAACGDDWSGIRVTAEVIESDVSVSVHVTELLPRHDGAAGHVHALRVTWNEETEVIVEDIRWLWYAPPDGPAHHYPPFPRSSREMPPHPQAGDSGLLTAGRDCVWSWGSVRQAVPAPGCEHFVGYWFTLESGTSGEYEIYVSFMKEGEESDPIPGRYVLEQPVRWWFADNPDHHNRHGRSDGEFTIRVIYEVRE